jgi:hypothetical protein
MAKMHEKMYKNSPELKRDEEDGKMKEHKGPTKAEKESSEVNAGTSGLPVHTRHAHERREVKHKHIHEHHALHHKHQMEHSHHDLHGEHKGEMHKRHHVELKAMHERHENEHKEMYARHEKEIGAGAGKEKIAKV